MLRESRVINLYLDNLPNSELGDFKSYCGFSLFNRTKICTNRGTNTIARFDLKYGFNILHTIFKFYLYGNSLDIFYYLGCFTVG